MRRAVIDRRTTETQIVLAIRLDGDRLVRVRLQNLVGDYLLNLVSLTSCDVFVCKRDSAQLSRSRLR